MRKHMLLLLAVLLVKSATAEVICSRDYGGHIVIGECWWVENGEYKKLTDVSTFTYKDGVFNFKGLGGEYNITSVVKSKAGTEYALKNVIGLKDTGDITQTGVWKFGLRLDTSLMSGVVKSNLDTVTFKTSGRLPDGVWLSYGDLLYAGFTVEETKDGLVVGNITWDKLVYLDPLLELQQNITKDAGISSYEPNTNFGDGEGLTIGQYGSAGARRYRVVTSFKMPDENLGTINDVTYSMYCTDSHNYPYAYNRQDVIMECSREFTEAGVTWNKYDGSNSWTNAGGDWNSSTIDQTTISGDCGSGPKYYNWTIFGEGAVNNLTLGWGGEYHFIILDLNENYSAAGDHAFDIFLSKETATYKPKLYITYGGATTTTTTTTVTTTTTTLLPYISACETNETTQLIGRPLLVTFQTSQTDLALDDAWAEGNNTDIDVTLIDIDDAQEGTNYMHWDTTGWDPGNYSVHCWVNDSGMNTVDEWGTNNDIMLYTTTTTTTTTTTIVSTTTTLIPLNFQPVIVTSSADFENVTFNVSSQPGNSTGDVYTNFFLSRTGNVSEAFILENFTSYLNVPYYYYAWLDGEANPLFSNVKGYLGRGSSWLGNLTITERLILSNGYTPASASEPCTKGEHAWDSSYIYVCVDTNTWKRTTLSTW